MILAESESDNERAQRVGKCSRLRQWSTSQGSRERGALGAEAKEHKGPLVLRR